MRHRRPLFVSLVFVAAWLAPALVMAQAPPAASEALRERVERLRDGSASVRGRVDRRAARALRAVREPRLHAGVELTGGARRAPARDPRRRGRRARPPGLSPRRAREAPDRSRAARSARGRVARLRPAAERRARPAALSPRRSARSNPADVSPQWNFHREIHRGPPAQFLQSVIDAPSLYAEVEREKPHYQMYRNLRAELARYRELRARGGWPPIPAGPALKPGARDPRVVALRARLAATGELVAPRRERRRPAASSTTPSSPRCARSRTRTGSTPTARSARARSRAERPDRRAHRADRGEPRARPLAAPRPRPDLRRRQRRRLSGVLPARRRARLVRRACRSASRSAQTPMFRSTISYSC